MNPRKTEGLLFGIQQPSPDILDISWLPEGTPTTYLGITIGNNISSTQRWAPVLEKINQSIGKWSSYPLPFSTRAVIIKCYLAPKIMYQLQVASLEKQTAVLLDRTLRRFLWNSTRGKIRKDRIYGTQKQGGLGIPDLAHETTSTRLLNLKRLTSEWSTSPSPSSELSKFFICNLASLGINRSLLYTSTKIDSDALCPGYYKENLSAWRSHGRTDPTVMKCCHKHSSTTL